MHGVYLDENLDPAGAVAVVLRRRKIDVLSVRERADLLRRNDEFHYLEARRLGRVLITRDRDFLAARFCLTESPGVVVLQTGDEDRAARLLDRLCERESRGAARAWRSGCKALVTARGLILDFVEEDGLRGRIVESFRL